MPLISCPDCKTQVSDKAPACPKCGAPIAPAKVTISHISPGADLNAPITIGKGKLTGVGIAGIAVGVLAFLLGVVAGGEAFLMGGGIFFIVASFLWARRPAPPR
jgi:hypothetical protein